MQYRSILEMLDAVERGITALNSRPAPGAAQPHVDREAAAGLAAELNGAGLSAHEFSKVSCIPQAEIEAWIEGTRPFPPWVHAAIRTIALLTPSARRKLLNGHAAGHSLKPNSHPFSRIEEL